MLINIKIWRIKIGRNDRLSAAHTSKYYILQYKFYSAALSLSFCQISIHNVYEHNSRGSSGNINWPLEKSNV